MHFLVATLSTASFYCVLLHLMVMFRQILASLLLTLVPNRYDFLYSTEVNTKYILKNASNKTVLVTTSIAWPKNTEIFLKISYFMFRRRKKSYRFGSTWV